jgi:SET domain-containing protein
MPPLPGLTVARSKVHGYGLIATRRFVRGEEVMAGDGVIWQEDETFVDSHALVLPAENADPSWPRGEDGEPRDFYYDLVDQTRWINHSCEANTSVDARWDPEAKIVRTWWTATRDIEPGDEIFYDYAFTAGVAEPCHCGAATCRGLIVDPDEIDLIAPELRPLLRLPSAA